MRSTIWYFFISFGLLAVLLVPATYAQVCTPAAPGLVSWWSGDGNAFDSRSRFNGTLQNGAGFSLGHSGQAFNFTAQNQYVDVPNDPALFPSNSITVEAWVNPSTYDGCNVQYRIAHTMQAQLLGWFTSISCSSNRFSAELRSPSGESNALESISTIPAGTFTHVAFTWDGTTLSLYINGVLDNSTATTISSIGVNADALRIGNDLTFGFIGQIDEPSVYNRALTADEIAAVHAAGTAGKCKPTATVAPSGLVGWWSGDGNANDVSSSRNDGIMQNGTGFVVGQSGQSFLFDGIDDRIDIPSTGIFKNQAGGTIEAWVRPLGPHGSGENGIVFYESVSSPNVRFALTVFNDGSVRSSGRDIVIGDAGVGKAVTTSPGSAPVGVWTHLASVWHPGSGVRVYVNGVLAASLNDPTVSNFSNTDASFLKIGAFDAETNNFQFFNGEIDEVSAYNRPLTHAEIESIFNAGAGGKLKNTVTSPRRGQVGFWRGEGNALDSSGFGNNGILTGTSSVPGQIGNALRVASATDKLSASGSGSLDIKGDQVTIEGWIRIENNVAHPAQDFSGVIGKNGFPNDQPYLLFFESGALAGGGNLPPNQWQFSYALANSSGQRVGNQNSNVIVTAGTFNHVAMTYNGSQPSSSNVKLYVNGVLQATNIIPIQQITGSLQSSPDEPFVFQTGASPFEADEIAIYNRELSAAEIAEIYNQGAGVKAETPASRKSFSPFGGPLPVTTTVGDVTVAFDTVTTGGTTQQIPLSGVGLPPLPFNPATSIIYDIATSAVFSGNVGLCFNLPTFTLPGQFAGLRVFHLENGNWTNRTTTRDFATRTLCAETTSLSPFAVGFFAPTSAPVSVGGRVVTATGNPIRGAAISIIDAATGETSRSITSSFGYYRFDGLAAGQTYILEVRSGRHSFQTPVRTVTAVDDIADLDFIADALFSPPGFKGSP